MQRIFIAAAAIGLAALLAGAQGAVSAVRSEQSGAAISPTREESEHPVLVSRCGREAVRLGALVQPTPPNAYMIANGNVFALSGALTCATRLHTARFFQGPVSGF